MTTRMRKQTDGMDSKRSRFDIQKDNIDNMVQHATQQASKSFAKPRR